MFCFKEVLRHSPYRIYRSRYSINGCGYISIFPLTLFTVTLGFIGIAIAQALI